MFEKEKKLLVVSCIIYVPAQLSRNWREQWPSNQGDIDGVSRERLEKSIALCWMSF
jgi:hypothetical protein